MSFGRLCIFFLLLASLIIGAVAFFVGSGRYNVAAIEPHWNVTTWLMVEIRDRSIAFHSKGIQPPALKNMELVPKGFTEYHAMCRLCHGAPGESLLEFAQGLSPKAPILASHAVQARGDHELYWIVKNGIKMTGMPAFGPTHDEEEVWSIISFLRQLGNLTPEKYEAMLKATTGKKPQEEKGHRHDSGKH
jgi:mono/diheme cytochrome c family protein